MHSHFFPGVGMLMAVRRNQPPGHTALFGLRTVSKHHPLVPRQTIAGSWAREGGELDRTE